MKNISSFATAFLPMTFITGLWGMNVKVPFQSGLNDGEAPTAFFIILASMFIGVIPFICVLKRLKWL
jgi:Mg2+ and Co2+ transporter CorA